MQDETARKRKVSLAAPPAKKKPGSKAYKVKKQDDGIGGQLTRMSETISRNNIYSTALSLTGLFIQIVVVEILHANLDEPNDFVNILKALVTVTTIGAIAVEFINTRSKFQYAKTTNELLEGDTLVSSRYLHKFLLLSLGLLIHSPPGLHFKIASQALSVEDASHGWHNIEYSSDEIITALMMLRLLGIPRVIFDLTGLSSESSRAMAMLYEEPITTQFFMRYLVRLYPLQTVGVFTGSCVLIFSYLVVLFERKADKTFESFFNALWLVFITISTIGYGDVFPHSVYGRITVMVLCVVSIICISLLISGVIIKFQMTQKQHKVVYMLQHSQMQHEIKAKAATAIGVAWRKFTEYEGTGKSLKSSEDLAAKLRSFRKVRKESTSTLDSSGQMLFKEMLALRENSELSLLEIDSKLSKMEKSVASIDDRLEAKLKDISESLKNSTKSLKNLQ